MRTLLKCMVTLLALIAVASTANAETKVWGFRGAGFEAWSQGVDQIAEQARHIHGVTDVRVFNYYETQQVYNEVRATPHGVRVAIYGYSCGANAATLIGTSLAGQRNVNEVLGMQPSLWCGGTPVLTQNVGYAQNTFAPCWATLGLGCQQWSGARRLHQIERIARHLYADEDPAYQQDVLGAIDYLANPPCDPARHRCHGHTLIIHRPAEGESRFIVLHHGQRP